MQPTNQKKIDVSTVSQKVSIRRDEIIRSFHTLKTPILKWTFILVRKSSFKLFHQPASMPVGKHRCKTERFENSFFVAISWVVVLGSRLWIYATLLRYVYVLLYHIIFPIYFRSRHKISTLTGCKFLSSCTFDYNLYWAESFRNLLSLINYIN